MVTVPCPSPNIGATGLNNHLPHQLLSNGHQQQQQQQQLINALQQQQQQQQHQHSVNHLNSHSQKSPMHSLHNHNQYSSPVSAIQTLIIYLEPFTMLSMSKIIHSPTPTSYLIHRIRSKSWRMIQCQVGVGGC